MVVDVRCGEPNCKGILKLKKGTKRTHVCTDCHKKYNLSEFRELEKEQSEKREIRASTFHEEAKRASFKDRQKEEIEE